MSCGVTVPSATQQNLQWTQTSGCDLDDEGSVSSGSGALEEGPAGDWSCCKLGHDSSLCWGFALPGNLISEGEEVKAGLKLHTSGHGDGFYDPSIWGLHVDFSLPHHKKLAGLLPFTPLPPSPAIPPLKQGSCFSQRH